MAKFNNKDIKFLNITDEFDFLNRMNECIKINENELNLLFFLSFDEEPVVRAQVADILGNIYNKKGEELLLRFLKDEDALVRTSACESLQFSKSQEVIEVLLKIAKKDPSTLVRGYAAYASSEIVKNLDLPEKTKYIYYYNELIKSEKVKWVKLNIFKSIYSLGDKSYFNKITYELNNKNFRIRSIAVKILKNIASDENRHLIIHLLRQRLKLEKTAIVKSIIQEVLKDLDYENEK